MQKRKPRPELGKIEKSLKSFRRILPTHRPSPSMAKAMPMAMAIATAITKGKGKLTAMLEATQANITATAKGGIDWGGDTLKEYTKPRQTIQSSTKLYKYITDYTKT